MAEANDMPRVATQFMRIEPDPERAGFFRITHMHPIINDECPMESSLQPGEIAELHVLLGAWMREYRAINAAYPPVDPPSTSSHFDGMSPDVPHE